MTGTLAGRHLLLIGPGYAARAVAREVQARGGRISAVLRDPGRRAEVMALGIDPIILGTDGTLPAQEAEDISDLLVSAPPAACGCPVLAALGPACPDLAWIGYYSSTAVYGDCGGAWIDENRAPAPRMADARARLAAEDAWRAEAARRGAALDILRIAGIYGPRGRNVIDRLRAGTARAIVKPGQVFNRIHRDDIAGATVAAMSAPAVARLTNISDGHPSPASEILLGVAGMLGLPAPPQVSLEEAGLPPGGEGFYAENRRLRNDRLCALPGFTLRHPDWRSGYRQILAEEAGEISDAT